MSQTTVCFITEDLSQLHIWVF